jgi:amidase
MSKSNPALVNLYFMSVYLSDRTKFPPSIRNRALTQVHQLRAAYDAVLDKYDVLILPSVPTVARKHPDFEKLDTVMDRVNLANGLSSMTSMFNITGHPALSMPVGWGRAEGADADAKLPVGMQMVAKRFGESTLYLAASAWEAGGLGLDQE